MFLVPHILEGRDGRKGSSQPIVSPEKPSTVLLSYQRSGAHWLTYCLYRLAVHHIIDYNQQWPELNRIIAKFPANPNATRPFFQAHHLKQLSEWRKKNLSRERDTLVLLVRDYKECYPRNRPDVPLLLLPDIEPHYFEDLEIYHNWPTERRYLVYYEDLIENLEATLDGVLTFLGEPIDGIPSFLENLEEHRRFVIKAYDKTWGSQSKGMDIHHHSKKIDPELLRQFDELVIGRYPHLLPYLERYLP